MVSKKGLVRISSFFKKNKASILTIVFLGIVADVIFLGKSEDIRIIIFLICYVVLIFIYKLKSKTTFAFALTILIVMSFLLFVTGPSVNTEKAAVWILFLMTIGIVQQIKE